MGDIKQVIIVRKDLHMRRGKEAAQCSHASMEFLKEHVLNNMKLSKKELEWLNGLHTKIVLSIDGEIELLELHWKALSKGLKSYIIQDAGKTEFNQKEYTAIAIGPDDSKKIDGVTSHLKLR